MSEVIEKVEEVDTEEEEELSKVKETKEVEVKAEEVINEELSKPATEPIKHSPETNTGEKPSGFKFSQNKRMSIKDRIFEKLNN